MPHPLWRWHFGPGSTTETPPLAQPFTHEAAGSTGVLLVHGFTGSPFEMRPLGADLHGRGLRVHAPLLAGHGAGPAALAATTWPEWLGSAEAALLELHGQLAAQGPPRLAVVGLSMGGLITLELSRRHPGLIRAIGLLATPLWLPRYQMRLARALLPTPLRRLTVPKLIGSDVCDPTLRFDNPSTRGIPVAALCSLCDFMDHARQHLAAVDRPAFVAHAQNDHTVPYACMAELLAHIGTPRDAISALSLPRSYHLITLDLERAVLFDALARHLTRYLA